MPSSPPEGEPVPSDGSLPSIALDSIDHTGFGVYIHIPFCVRRCGYCDFNSYAGSDPAAREEYVSGLLSEISLLVRAFKGTRPQAIDTIFFGGGTPTILEPRQFAVILDKLHETWGLGTGAEITTEANPETVTPQSLRELRSVGLNRISLGAQSVSAQVLATLDRQHAPERPAAAVAEAKEAGFEHLNLDLIYGTPGETAADFADSLRMAIDSGVDHVSAYSLTVEDGTRLAAQVDAGLVRQPEDDTAADRYLAAEQILTAAGFGWYEISSWARTPEARCRHNLGYWRNANWVGLGAGAHSHIGGVRWWNHRHPGAYQQRLSAGLSPGQGREVLNADERQMERILLSLRMAEGLPVGQLTYRAVVEAQAAVEQGLLDPEAWQRGHAVLTLRGRLLADLVTRKLLP